MKIDRVQVGEVRRQMKNKHLVKIDLRAQTHQFVIGEWLISSTQALNEQTKDSLQRRATEKEIRERTGQSTEKQTKVFVGREG